MEVGGFSTLQTTKTMYGACIFCQRGLGRNAAVEHFPVGRRLAFDAERGRLWVVCDGCRRWNLSPIEERWEAIEEAERLFRATRLRVSTENIGLARLREGTELIRIGRPLRPEFAAWRYAGQFRRRRRRQLAVIGAGALAFTVVSPVIAATGGVLAGLGFFGVTALMERLRQPELRPQVIRTQDDEPITVAENALWHAVRIRPNDRAEDGWELVIQHPFRTHILTGDRARVAAARLLPLANLRGAGPKVVEAAVRELEEAGHPARYFALAELRARSMGYGYNPIAAMPEPIRLALEMASQEETERRALEGELALLEQVWKDAEGVAAIADSLTIPERIDAFVRQWRREGDAEDRR